MHLDRTQILKLRDERHYPEVIGLQPRLQDAWNTQHLNAIANLVQVVVKQLEWTRYVGLLEFFGLFLFVVDWSGDR